MNNETPLCTGTKSDSERYLRAILQTAIDGFLVLDSTTMEVIDANEAYCKMSGYTRDELLDCLLSELEYNEKPRQIIERARRIIQNGSDFFQTRHKRKDGSIFDVEVSITFLPIYGGRFILFCRDITERKKTEEKLSHSHDLMRYIIEHNRSSVAVHDRELRYIYVSQRYIQDFNLQNTDIIGKYHYDVFPNLSQHLRDVHQRALNGEVISCDNDTYVTNDGEVIWSRWECRPWYDEHGSIGGIIIYTEDITEAKRAEESLRQGRELLRNIIDSSTDYIYVKDQNLRTLLCNNMFASALGKEPGELIGKTDIENGWNPKLIKGIPGFGTEGFESDDHKVLNGETIHVIDACNVNNSVRIFDTLKMPLYSDDKKIIGVLGISRDITERKQAEDELRNTKERMQFALSASQIGAWDIDLEHNSLFHTLELDQIFGYDKLQPDWNFESFLKHIHPDYRTMFNEIVALVKERKNNLDFECRIIRKDGEIRWARICGRYHNDIEGRSCHIAGIIQDITESKHAKEQIVKSHDLLANLARLVPGVIYQFRLYPDGRSSFPYSSPGMYDIYELTPEDVCEDATPVFGRLHPEDRDRVSMAVHQSARTLQTFYCEYRVVLPHQGLRWRWSHAHPERTDDGGTLWHGIISDITERKIAEEAIAAEKELLSVTLRSIADGVITTDISGNVFNMNNVAEELTGWSQKDARGKTLSEIFYTVHETTREPYKNPVLKVLSSGQTIDLTNNALLISRNGTERIIAQSYAPIKDRNNAIIGAVLVFRDITEKEKLLNIIQRTAKLDSIGVLAGGIAHDFNNLLGGIFGYIDMAIENSPDSNVVDYLSKAINTIDRARGLTQQLLTFAKGGTPVKIKSSLFPFVEEVAQFALSGSNVSCKIEKEDKLWMCEFDKNQIAQVIDNIVINGQQAMPNGGTMEICAVNIKIKSRKHPTLQPGNYVKISFKDTGTGITKENLNRIFDPFYTTKFKGHGLGLATCYSILNKHGGCIEVESEPGKGSIFDVFLPACDDATLYTPIKEYSEHTGSGAVLIMDDEEVMRDITAEMLKILGYTAITVTNGKEALATFTSDYSTNRNIIAMIFDLTVPGAMGGKETILEIRKLSPTIPVFVSSGYAEDPIMSNPVKYGFTASISKPFNRAELTDLFQKYVKKSNS